MLVTHNGFLLDISDDSDYNLKNIYDYSSEQRPLVHKAFNSYLRGEIDNRISSGQVLDPDPVLIPYYGLGGQKPPPKVIVPPIIDIVPSQGGSNMVMNGLSPSFGVTQQTGFLGDIFGGLFGGGSSPTPTPTGIGIDPTMLMMLMMMGGGRRGGMNNMLMMLMLFGGLGGSGGGALNVGSLMTGPMGGLDMGKAMVWSMIPSFGLGKLGTLMLGGISGVVGQSMAQKPRRRKTKVVYRNNYRNNYRRKY